MIDLSIISDGDRQDRVHVRNEGDIFVIVAEMLKENSGGKNIKILATQKVIDLMTIQALQDKNVIVGSSKGGGGISFRGIPIVCVS